jgi:sorbitol-specific phosphotransferase system component IIA
MHLGYKNEDTYPLAEVEPEVWDELQKRGHVTLRVSGLPSLTAKGEITFAAMEAGKDVPEFTYDGEE